MLSINSIIYVNVKIIILCIFFTYDNKFKNKLYKMSVSITINFYVLRIEVFYHHLTLILTSCIIISKSDIYKKYVFVIIFIQIYV